MMALVECKSELGCSGSRFEDNSEQKMQRAANRSKNQYFKRGQYKEKNNKKMLRWSYSCSLPAAPVGNDRTNPHGIKRVAIRTCLAKGMAETALDLPIISMGRVGTWVPWVRKPSVARRLGHIARDFRVGLCADKVDKAKVQELDDDAATTCPNSPNLEAVPDEEMYEEGEQIMLLAPSVGVDEAIDIGYFDGCFEDHSEQKMQRAASRARKQYLKHKQYTEKRIKAQLRRSQPRSLTAAPVGKDRTNPHGIKRTAARTCLAKGVVETASDMPIISMGHVGRWVPWVRKPSVAPCLVRLAHEDLPEITELASDEITSESEFVLEAVDKAKVKELDFDSATTCPNSPDIEASPAEESDEEDEGESIMLPAPSVDVDESERIWQQLASGSRPDDDHESCAQTIENGISDTPNAEITRETVMQRVIEAQRIQAQETAAEMATAIARAEEAERRARDAEQSIKKAKTPSLREAAQIEKRVSAELRRKRNQEDHSRALLEKAGRVLEEAKKTKEDAEANAVAEQVRILAATQAEAKIEADNTVRVAMVMAEEQAKAMISERLEAATRIEAELRAKAEDEALQARQFAEEMAQAERTRAESDARAVREKAEADARALKQRVENALRAKAENEAKARNAMQEEARLNAEADAKARSLAEADEAAKAKREADSLARREAAESIKRAKEQEQHRSKQFRREAEQQRRQELEQQKMVEAAKKEGQAMTAEALAEAQAAKDQAEAKMRQLQVKVYEAQATVAQRAQAMAEEQAKAIIDERLEAVARTEFELRAKAEAEAVHVRKTAEEMAQAERARAEADARAVREKAEADARALKLRVENALRAKAENEAIAREAEQEEARLKTEADAKARLLAEADESAKAKRKADALARREAAESLKRAKEQELHRSKHFRRQAEQQRRQELDRKQIIDAAKEADLATSAKVVAEAKAAQAQAEATMRELAAKQARVEEEVHARLAVAEAQAFEIRARAEEEARLLREQALCATTIAPEPSGMEASEDLVIEDQELEEMTSDDNSDWEVLPDNSASDLTDGEKWELVA